MRTRLPAWVMVMAAAAALSSCAPASEIPEHPFPVVGEADALPPIGERVGFAHQLVWGDEPAQKARRESQLARLRSLGVQHVRMDFTWHRLEKKPGEWDLSALDAVVRDAQAAGIAILAVACYGNPIYPSKAGQPAATPSTNLPLDNPPEVHFPPTDPAHYARYVEVIARRYGDRVKRFELWNEQNLGYRFWRPEASGAEYVRYARAAALAGKAGCADCKFAIGGLSMPQPVPRLDLYRTGPAFLEDMYAAAPDMDAWIDAIGFHPYPMPKDAPEVETAAFPDRFQGSLATQARQMREVVARRGKSIPLWITENGWPTNPGIPADDEDVARIFGLAPGLVAAGRSLLGEEDYARLLETIRGVPEDVQARYLVRSVLLGAVEGIGVNMLYGLDDYDVEPLINQESAFGVFRHDGTEKPAAPALRALVGRFGSYRFVSDARTALGLDESYRAVLLRSGERALLALWRWREGASDVRLTRLPGKATVYDQRGVEVASAAGRAELDVRVGGDVVYVEVVP